MHLTAVIICMQLRQRNGTFKYVLQRMNVSVYLFWLNFFVYKNSVIFENISKIGEDTCIRILSKYKHVHTE